MNVYISFIIRWGDSIMKETTMALSRQTLNFYRLYNEKIARRFKAKHVDELSQVEYLLMAIVVSEERMPIKSLCERTCMLKQQVTKNLNRLQELGYITRERDPRNRRVVLVTATEKAYALQNRVQQDTEEELSRIFGALDTEAADTYLKALETINDILDRFPKGIG